MELKFTDNQLVEIVDVIIGYWCKEEINNRLYENDYLKNKGIDDLSPEEFQAAVQVLHDRMYDNIIEGDWGLNAMNVIDCIVAERPQPEPKEPPKDYLNDTLKMIGLETMQCFRIDDVEFKDQTLCIDSFGDVFVVVTEATDDFYEEGDEIEHDYLTLGRILTQYYDKIVPVKEE